MKLLDSILEGFIYFLGGCALTILVVSSIYYYTNHLVVACKPRACLIYLQ